jgi:hypothetical protein
MKKVVFWDIKTPVRISQETHYVSATESSLLMLSKIWGFHGGHYEESVIITIIIILLVIILYFLFVYVFLLNLSVRCPFHISCIASEF